MQSGHVLQRFLCVVLLGIVGMSCASTAPDRTATGASPSTTTDGSSQSSTDGSQKTVIIRVAPVGADGTVDEAYHVIAVKDRAICPRPSGLVFLAFACTAGHFIFDPCWEEAAAEPSVVCKATPWSDEVRRLVLEQPISVKPLEGVNEPPWGVALKTGLRCRLGTGAHGTVGPAVIDYYCGDDEAVVLLRGTIDRSSAYWTAEAAARTNGGFERVEDQTIATVWFGS